MQRGYEWACVVNYFSLFDLVHPYLLTAVCFKSCLDSTDVLTHSFKSTKSLSKKTWFMWTIFAPLEIMYIDYLTSYPPFQSYNSVFLANTFLNPWLGTCRSVQSPPRICCCYCRGDKRTKCCNDFSKRQLANGSFSWQTYNHDSSWCCQILPQASSA